MTVREQAQISAARLVTSQDWLALVAWENLQNIDAVAGMSDVDFNTLEGRKEASKYQREMRARLDFIADVNQLANEHKTKQKQEEIE